MFEGEQEEETIEESGGESEESVVEETTPQKE